MTDRLGPVWLLLTSSVQRLGIEVWDFKLEYGILVIELGLCGGNTLSIIAISNNQGGKPDHHTVYFTLNGAILRTPLSF